MNTVIPYTRFNYLTQEEHVLPLNQTIPRIHSILEQFIRSSAIPPETFNHFLDRYAMVLTQIKDMILSRNIEQNPTAMIANWIGLREDACKLIYEMLDSDPIFFAVMQRPIETSPIYLASSYVPPLVREFWNIVTFLQFMLPIVSESRLRFNEAYRSSLTFSSMLCILDQFIQMKYPNGWEFICNHVYRKAVIVPVGSEDLLGMIALTGLTQLDLSSTSYINMLDIESILGAIIAQHPIFK